MTFDEVCNELRLCNTPDWGIINSDSSRVVEFINYVIAHDKLNNSIQFEFIELIIASMNDALLGGSANCKVHGKFYGYIIGLLNKKNFLPQIQYWISIKSEKEYPVGYLIEKFLKEDSQDTV